VKYDRAEKRREAYNVERKNEKVRNVGEDEEDEDHAHTTIDDQAVSKTGECRVEDERG
jgi:hypothetical protein